MNLKRCLLIMAICLLSTVQIVFATQPYLDEEDYTIEADGNYYEDKGIVVENEPNLGYLIYKNANGEEITATYYSKEMGVEKQPYYEAEDRIGYIDEIFPSFQFDLRDTTIANIKAGDNIYVKMDDKNVIKYISAYNDYITRYGKVHSWILGGEGTGELVLQDDKGRLYSYTINIGTPITKVGKNYTLAQLKAGEWAKLLVSQKILGEGIIIEEVLEIVVDADSRVISDVYAGELVSVDGYKNTINLKDAQAISKNGWGPYKDIATLRADPRVLQSYFLGNPVSWDYISRTLSRTGGTVYAAVEDFMGKSSAVKLNFQNQMQRTLEPSQVIYAAPGVIKLLSGETLSIAQDAIVVKDKRLVDFNSIMVGDTLQPVITGADKIAVANILPGKTTGDIQIFRGRIKKIQDRQSFEVETFSMLEDNLWYFHPAPRTFSIGSFTKFYGSEGFMNKGIEDFLAYGEKTQVSEVYTIMAVGDEARAIIDMPYTRESIKGEVYAIDDENISVKDVYYYHTTQKKWLEYSRKNVGTKVKIEPNSMIVKNGQLIPANQLEIGDELLVMLEKPIEKPSSNESNDNGNAGKDISGYIIVVQ